MAVLMYCSSELPAAAFEEFVEIWQRLFTRLIWAIYFQ
jgi:hypothetical protein